MMKTYPQRDNARVKKQKQIYLFGVLACLAFIVLASFFFPRFLSPFADDLGTPMLRSRTAIGDMGAGLWDVLHSKLTLIQENNGLRQQLALMDAVKAERDAALAHNSTLEALFNRSKPGHFGTLAQILAKPGFSPYDTILVDAGSNQNITVGDLAVADQSVVVGEVSNVNADTSTITLYSSPDEKNNIFIGTTSIETMAVGQGGGVFEVKLPKNTAIAENDSVFLAKEPDYILGAIGSVSDASADSFENILFRSPVNLGEISYITIMPDIKAASTTLHQTIHGAIQNHR